MRRLWHLDGLRGWAALFVILHHLELAFFPAIKGTNDGVSPVLGPLSFLVDGPLAVAIFFLLSGIVLAEATRSATDQHCGQIGLAGLILKRWLRLTLPIIAAGLLILVLFVMLGNRTTEASLLTQSDWMHSLFPIGYQPAFSKVLLEAAIGAFLGPQTPIHDPVLWTIRVEFLGSILVFALCLFVPRGFGRFLACGLVADLLIAIPAWLPNFCALFAIGIMLGDLAAQFDQRFQSQPMICDSIGLGMILIAALLYPVLDLVAPTFMDGVGSLIDPMNHLSQWTARSILIVAGTLLSPSMQTFLRLPISLFLGRISFGLYLLHLPILLSLGLAGYLALEPLADHDMAALSACLLVLSGSLVSAFAFHYAIEQPSIRLAARAESFASGRG
jgi:peptidoglycan/LPS O-acetylase OafA/YrhL